MRGFLKDQSHDFFKKLCKAKYKINSSHKKFLVMESQRAIKKQDREKNSLECKRSLSLTVKIYNIP